MKYKIVFIVFLSLLFSGCSLLGQKNIDTSSQPTVINKQTNSAQPSDVTNFEPVTDETRPTVTNVAKKNTLDLSNQSLSKIPNDVFSNTNLQELNVSSNQLTGAIQAEIRHLQNLVVLNASNNQMTGVPAEIGQLEKLEVLNLSNNQLTGLPYELGNLKNLKILNISGNNYSTLDLGIITEKLPSSVQIIK